MPPVRFLWFAFRPLIRAVLRGAGLALLLLAVARAQRPTSPAWEVPALTPPADGTRLLTIVSPHMLEITAVVAGSPVVPQDGPFAPPAVPRVTPVDFTVTVDGVRVEVAETGFRRRVVYAPEKHRDLRVGNYIYLRLAEPLADNKNIEVVYTGRIPWLAPLRLRVESHPLRFGPAIHVNQVGYAPDAPKTALVGYYLGSLGELLPPEPAEFSVIDVRAGKTVHQGQLSPRPERGLPHGWYRRVMEANFTALRSPGEYRIMVAGHGASFPFFIDAGIPAAFARTYALGIYHQRCGAALTLPFTRFVHAACHTAPVKIPTAPVRTLKGFDETEPGADLFPYVRRGALDASGGHHDAGDYSKYTINSTGFINTLVFAADNFAGAVKLDNLGLPESGDGRSDLLQIVKWEADFLVKMQDEDGAFFFLVYPRDRRYEGDVLPEHGDPQIVWPKNTAATAAAVAALAQCASSPAFSALYPDAAKSYLEVARRGWRFLLEAEQRLGRGEAYRKFTHYGDEFKDADEIAWAACELFLATGDPAFEKILLSRFDPRDPKTRKWGWRRLTESYGRATRSYAFGARSGRLPRAKLERMMLKHCEDELIACAEDWLRAAKDTAYGTSYPEPSKRVTGGGWYFSADQAFDLAVAAQLDFPAMADRRPAFREAAISNLNYEAGANPVNVCYITGLGWKRPLEIVHQYSNNDRRGMPLSGIPLGSIQEGFTWLGTYKGELGAQSFPLDGDRTAPYPILDRWGDSFNLQTEFVILNQARALAVSAWLMAQTPLREQPWRAVTAEIQGVPASSQVGKSVRLKLHAPGLDLAEARIVWEGHRNPPRFTREFDYIVREAGAQWVEVEAQWPDGRRVFATGAFSAGP